MLAMPMSAFAQRHGREGGRDGRHRPAMEVVPRGWTRMVLNNQEYFYAEGKFYRRGPTGYVVVAAPVGARIGMLAPGFATVRLGRLPFFVSFGTYYRYDPLARMYVVVEPPPNAPAAESASPGNYDKLNLSTGETITGTYLGGSPDSVQMQVGNNVETFAIDQINSIQFAPPAPK